jgi:hypothetical protein
MTDDATRKTAPAFRPSPSSTRPHTHVPGTTAQPLISAKWSANAEPGACQGARSTIPRSICSGHAQRRVDEGTGRMKYQRRRVRTASRREVCRRGRFAIGNGGAKARMAVRESTYARSAAAIFIGVTGSAASRRRCGRGWLRFGGKRGPLSDASTDASGGVRCEDRSTGVLFFLKPSSHVYKG